MKKLPVIKADKWLNSRPLVQEDVQEKIILVDFWSSTCLHCRRDVKYLRKWWQKYKDKGFLLLGIHVPKFDFEKDENYLNSSLKELGIEWPVVMDDDFVNWHNFENTRRPERYISDIRGNIIYHQSGEGNYDEVEQIILGLLSAKNPDTSFPLRSNGKSEEDFCITHTPNLYCGYSRGGIVNREGYRLGRTIDYEKPRLIPDDSIGLSGKWRVGDEYLESVSDNAEVYLNFQAKEVNLIASSAKEEVSAEIKIDDNIPIVGEAGKNLNLAGEVNIKSPSIYQILNSKKSKRSTLKMLVRKGGVRIYSFSFYGC